MKIFLTLIFAFISSAVSAQGEDTLKYRIRLKDKRVTTYSLSRPHEFLSEKSINRRIRQHIPIDSTDLPVCRKYIDDIEKTGVKIVAVGKWDNFVTISCNDTTLIGRIAGLPFVQDMEKVWTVRKTTAQKTMDHKNTLSHKKPDKGENWYGNASDQIRLCQGDKLHAAGFKGKGKTIAVIDEGFHNANVIKLLENACVLGTKDFVNPLNNIYAEGDHGTRVFSCMAMDQPYVMVGTAPEASYWLLRSEDSHSENLIEQDYWAAAVEFADSVGVDMINTSLGYHAFDDSSKNYTHNHLDGHYALISRQASKVADKGMVMVCSAGNTGNGLWKKITPPADADNVLTVGSVDSNAVLAGFSSIGNTTDGRIKPDVVALGVAVEIVHADGDVGEMNGTSFSSPVICGMVACLWQACPQLTAKEVIALVRQSGDRYDYPDSAYGYGIPDMWKAYESGKFNSLIK
ncbi:Subtilisin DY [termite gut metagenome]|uniref:Subtilisin DY n=1 Tax=termite gut metagenome TaxID=433724 RepID=A0A5J4R5Z1_9ZZZZ